MSAAKSASQGGAVVNIKRDTTQAECMIASALGVFELIAEADDSAPDSAQGNALWSGIYNLRQGLALLRQPHGGAA